MSGYIEEGETPDQTARKEIMEELSIRDPEFVRSIDPIRVRGGDTIWAIHPFLFRAKDRAVTIDWEHTEYRWALPAEMAGLKTVPGLESVYRSLLS